MFYALILIGGYFTANALINPQPAPEPQPPIIQYEANPCAMMNCDGIIDWDGSPLK